MRFVPAVALLACMAASAQGSSPLLHHQAPQFVRTDLQHQTVDLSRYRGHVVLLNFWATWCAPCQVEIPRFVEWQTRYQAQGLQIIGISMDDDSVPVKALTRRRRVNYPVLMGDERLGSLYGGILGLPVTFLIDRDGSIAARYKGQTSLSRMQGDLERLLRTSPPARQ